MRTVVLDTRGGYGFWRFAERIRSTLRRGPRYLHLDASKSHFAIMRGLLPYKIVWSDRYSSSSFYRLSAWKVAT